MPWPPRFIFISGRLCLDFVHTGGEGFRARWERWGTPRDLAEWIAACPPLGATVRVRRRDLEEARELREAVWAAAQAVIGGRAVPSGALGVIRRMARRPNLVPDLEGGKKVWAAGADASRVLSEVARDAIELLGSPLRSRLRECRNPRCFLLFVDASRPGKRAWCTMRRCGNLEKISRYRKRGERTGAADNAGGRKGRGAK